MKSFAYVVFEVSSDVQDPDCALESICRDTKRFDAYLELPEPMRRDQINVHDLNIEFDEKLRC